MLDQLIIIYRGICSKFTLACRRCVAVALAFAVVVVVVAAAVVVIVVVLVFVVVVAVNETDTGLEHSACLTTSGS